MRSDLKCRHETLHCEVISQFECTAALENHWLMYTLIGWQHLASCGISHYLLEVKGIQRPIWPYLVVWGTQILAALATIKLVSGRPTTVESPIEPLNKRVWTMFLLLAINVCVLNLAAGQPIFAFMPTLATLSAMAFTFMTTMVSRRFMAAGLAMVVTGMAMARHPHHQFLIYGAGWLVVLQSLSIVLWNRRKELLGNSRRAGFHQPLPNHEPLGTGLATL